MKTRVRGTITVRLDIDTGDEDLDTPITLDAIDEVMNTVTQDLRTIVSFVAEAHVVEHHLTVDLQDEP